jgi:hypothetical protein
MPAVLAAGAQAAVSKKILSHVRQFMRDFELNACDATVVSG